MLPGYNHNIKYKDRVYHVQTEDSGVQNPHVITHLFVGGNIIETVKTSYSDIVASDKRDELLQELMQGQHKTMLRNLIKGAFDSKIATRSVNAATLNGPAPLNVEAGAQHRASFGLSSTQNAPAAPTKPAAAPTPIAVPPVAKPKVPTPPPAPRPAAPAPTALSSFFGSAPPATERIIEAETLEKAFDSKNESAVDSIFGGDLISEKSLDEVILSYLAEDLHK